MFKLKLNEDGILDLLNISFGLFKPLKGFLNESDYRNAVDNLHLSDNTVWSIPITLEINEEQKKEMAKNEIVELTDESGTKYGELEVEDIFTTKLDADILKIFGTTDMKHPGVNKEFKRGKYRIGGKTKLTIEKKSITYLDEYFLFPDEVKKQIKEKNLKTIAGFQTRNAPHRAHEYLQRTGLEFTDGIFIHPLIGWKKADDFSPVAVKAAYKEMVDNFYPKDKVIFSVLQTAMRYAGPREAVFHAIIRKNYGCTHFIVGRDHAGVGNYYDKYEAQRFASNIDDLGIKIICLSGPFYCEKCGGIATEKNCGHYNTQKQFITEISGTDIRNYISEFKRPPENIMRKEIADILIELHKKKLAFGAYE